MSNEKKIIFTNGCFDILHVGHIHVLKEARSLGDKLVVGLNSDSSVTRLKGSDRPINNEDDRLRVLSSIRYVDEVIIFNDDDPLDLIKEIKPDVIVKGADYSPVDIVGYDFVTSYGGEVRIISLINQKSTSNIIKKINK